LIIQYSFDSFLRGLIRLLKENKYLRCFVDKMMLVELLIQLVYFQLLIGGRHIYGVSLVSRCGEVFERSFKVAPFVKTENCII